MKKSGPQESDFTARGSPWQVVIPDGVEPGDEFEADARVRGGPYAVHDGIILRLAHFRRVFRRTSGAARPVKNGQTSRNC
jgi:hypothetical protein